MRAIGDDFEDEVVKALGSGFSKTANSGAMFRDGDIKHPRLVVECKVDNGAEGFNAPKNHLQKLKRLSLDQGKDWIYIKKTKSKTVMVLMDFDTFLELSESWRQKNGGIK